MFIRLFVFFGTRTICRKKQVETAPLENIVLPGLAAGRLRSIIEGRLYMEKNDMFGKAACFVSLLLHYATLRCWLA